MKNALTAQTKILCAVHTLMTQLRDSSLQIFRNTTLADLCGK